MSNENSVGKIAADRPRKNSMDSSDKAAVIIGLGFLALVAILFIVTLRTMNNAAGFLQVWSAVGPIVGVVIGSMPAYFFRSIARTANDRADTLAREMAHMSGGAKADDA
jgi:hypothetical protein